MSCVGTRERGAYGFGIAAVHDASLTAIAGIGAIPVTDREPAGSDAADTPEYADILHQISRIALDGVRSVDWQQVVADAEVILRDRSKNLRIAAYLAYGLYETHGLRGLGVGLGVLSDLCDGFWDHLHPPPSRMRGRVLALEWLAERVLAALERADAQPDPSGLELAVIGAEKLAATLARHSPDAGDRVRALVPVLRARRDALAREADARERRAGSSAVAAPAPQSRGHVDDTSGGRPDGDPAERREREKSLRELARTMLDAARELRVADAGDVRAYTLLRASIWLPIRELPPAVAGRTDLPPPTGEIRGAIEAAMRAGDYPGALAMCEDAATDSLFWFDAHRVSAEALAGMGHEAAARAIRSQAGALLFRMPALAGLSFNDGTPFAEPVTRQWLEPAADQAGESGLRAASASDASRTASTRGPVGMPP